jgi:NAD(P)H-flavin reductase
VFLNIPSVSWRQFHPFSVTSGPDSEDVELNVCGSGRFARKLMAKVKEHVDAPLLVRVDGPYGNTRLVAHRRYDVCVFRAGGVGVTPIISYLKDIYRVGDMYATAAAAATPRMNIRCVRVVWSVGKPDDASWFTEVFDAIAAKVAAAPKNAFPRFVLSVHCSKLGTDGGQPTVAGPAAAAADVFNNDGRSGTATVDLNLVRGRPDMTKELLDLAAVHVDESMFIFSCGPKGLTNDVWDAACRLKKKAKRSKISFHHEVFDW